MTGSEPSPHLPELARCLAEPGYTPPVRVLEALVAALVALPDAPAQQLERALARAGAPALQAAVRMLAAGEAGEHPRLIGLLVRFAGERAAPELGDLLLRALHAPLAQSRKLAARGLAKLGDSRAEAHLLAELERASGPERKSIVDALGAVGGEQSRGRLAALQTDEADLARRRERARALIERRLIRTQPGELVLDVSLDACFRVALSCRRGLAELLASELGARARPVVRSPERVDIEHTGSLGELLVARIALDVALVAPLEGPSDLAPEEAIADALASAACVTALRRWTRGVPRFRVGWSSGGHRRGLTWALDRALRARTSAIANDSYGARWTVRAPPDGRGELLIVPLLRPDPRFAYRVADVPAASHPTIAAALARVAGVEADDVVWDPFVGSGLELIERARLGPARELWGSDIDARALAAARQNLQAADVAARLVEKNALDFSPPAPSLIITNPPMGRRVARDGSVGELLERFVRHAAKVLRPAGRLVWLSPLARRTERAARSVGLEVQAGPEVDLGGFTAHVQVCRRRV